jgi:hypothetical protein
VFNTVSRPGHTTMGEMLGEVRTVTGSVAELIWAPPAAIAEAGVAPWTELPIWLPPDGELAGLHNGDVGAAYRRGLRCRPVTETIRDTWAWLEAEGDPPSLSDGSVGLSAEREAAVLARLGATT